MISVSMLSNSSNKILNDIVTYSLAIASNIEELSIDPVTYGKVSKRLCEITGRTLSEFKLQCESMNDIYKEFNKELK